MDNKDIRRLEESLPGLKDTICFHGHFCPGLAIGYRAASIAMERLGIERAGDEELVAIVENNSCSVDAVQFLTGCTFGKGNFIFHDYGKQVFTFAVRPGGRAVRIAYKPDVSRRPEVQSLDRDQRIAHILTAPVQHLFDVQDVSVSMPPMAHIRETFVCDFCGEGVMSTRTVDCGGRTSCIPCFRATSGQPAS